MDTDIQQMRQGGAIKAIQGVYKKTKGKYKVPKRRKVGQKITATSNLKRAQSKETSLYSLQPITQITSYIPYFIQTSTSSTSSTPMNNITTGVSVPQKVGISKLEQDNIKIDYQGSIQGLSNFFKGYNIVDKNFNSKPKKDLEKAPIEQFNIPVEEQVEKQEEEQETYEEEKYPITPIKSKIGLTPSPKSKTGPIPEGGKGKRYYKAVIEAYREYLTDRDETIPEDVARGLSKKSLTVLKKLVEDYNMEEMI